MTSAERKREKRSTTRTAGGSNVFRPTEEPASGAGQGNSTNPPASESLFELAERALAAAYFGCLIAGTLVPSEAVAFGVTLPLVTFQAVILAAWFGLCAWSGRPVRLGVVALALLATGAWTLASGAVVVLGQTGDARAAITMSVQWMGYVLSFVAAASFVDSPDFRRYALILVVAAGAAWATMGGYDYFVAGPARAAEYFSKSERQKFQMLSEQGVDGTSGSDQRNRFEDRLRSVEPIATFSLTNTLAGFLLPAWALATFGLARQVFGKRDALRLVAWIGVWLLIAFVLFLTKSRTAWGAAALTGGALAILFLVREKRLPWTWLVGGAVALAALGGVAWMLGAVDREVFTEAAKSFEYRIEYWRSTVAMIGERPALGTGPGNFAAAYLHEKLPQASEEIKDPHQWLLEIAATAGLPAAILVCGSFLLAIGCGVRAWMRGEPSQGNAASDSPSLVVDRSAAGKNRTNGDDVPFLKACPYAIYDLGAAGGAIVGLALSFLFLLPPDIAMWCAGTVAFAVVRWTLGGTNFSAAQIAGASALAAAGLLIHLSASGGIAYPGVAPWLLLLIALAVGDSSPAIRVGRLGVLGLSLAASVFACVVQFWAVPPVLPTGPVQIAIARADGALADGAVPQADREATLAATLDPYAPAPLRTSVYARYFYYLGDPRPARLDAFRQAADEAVRRDPANYAPYLQAGDRLLLLAVHGKRPELFDPAIERHRQAVERYPNASWLHAQLAVSFDAAERPEEALSALAEAERLDALNPHADRRLARQLIVDPASPTETVAAGDWIARFRERRGYNAR